MLIVMASVTRHFWTKNIPTCIFCPKIAHKIHKCAIGNKHFYHRNLQGPWKRGGKM
jgi:hypothetical protein